MSCTLAPFAVDPLPEIGTGSTGVSKHDQPQFLTHRGRSKSYHVSRRRQSIVNADAVFLRVDIFLEELKSRLSRLEKYKQESLLQLDAHLERSFNALRDVRDSCSPAWAGELLWGAARQRAAILVDTLETRCNVAISTRETLEHKAQLAMRTMEAYLTELESRVQSRRRRFIRSGLKRVDTSLQVTREMIETGLDAAIRAKDSLAESISRALTLAAESTLIKYEDLPTPWQCNPHILRGYRFNKTTFDCVVSMFRPSNETVNIWSHAFGLVLVLAIAFHYYPSSIVFTSSTKWDILISATFFIAACKCMVCSVCWHTFNSISDKCLLERFACVDYTGIAMLVAASILTCEWTAFYCEPVSRTIWMTSTVIFGIAGTILPWRESFNRADMAWARVVFFVGLAATGLAPFFQLCLMRGFGGAIEFISPLAKSLLVYLGGAIIYASKVPEKWWPGLFDYAGASHNIWHLAVLGGILFHYTAMTTFFQGAFSRTLESEGMCRW